GLDRGDPEVLATAAERLSRLCHRLVWMNPHKGDDAGFRPSTLGMMVGAPHVGLMLSGHDLRSLEEVAGLLPSLGEECPVRWSVGIEAEGDRVLSREEVVELADAVAASDGIASGIGSKRYGVTLIVRAGSQAEAIAKATEEFTRAAVRAGLP